MVRGVSWSRCARLPEDQVLQWATDTSGLCVLLYYSLYFIRFIVYTKPEAVVTKIARKQIDPGATS